MDEHRAFPRLLGRQAAAWVLMSSEWIDAAEAEMIGLAWKVVPLDAVLAEAQALAGSFAQHPLSSLLACKRLLSATFVPAVVEGLRRENVEFDALLGAPENRAAVDAFVEGRQRARGER